MYLVNIQGGSFLMGTDDKTGFAPDLEGPTQQVEVDDFQIGTYTVTNQEFLEFFLATGYVTDAERFGASFVFDLLLPEEVKKQSQSPGGASWWYEVAGACWRMPEGPGSTIEDRMDHPVTHVSRNDAIAYCEWAGVKLPTEAQWEYAARGGHENRTFPWGNEKEPDGNHMANLWQGDFPNSNSQEDGYLGTASVDSFEPNDYGLYQMTGNVWEWCANPAPVNLTYFKDHDADGIWQSHHDYSQANYALRGGSFLCHDSYCRRYRVAGRNNDSAVSSSSNIGFRVAKY